MRNLYQQDPILERCNNIPQLLSIRDVINYISLSRFTIYDMINEESDRYDPMFQKKVQITKVRVVWVASDIAEWINNKIGKC